MNKPKNQANRWFHKAMKKDDWDSGLPPISGKIYKNNDFTIHRFKDGSEIISGYALYWTREMWDHNSIIY